jgi:hypothetical protein
MKRVWVLGGLLVLLLVAIAYAETVYVRSRSASLRQGKSSVDQVVTRVGLGEALEVLIREEGWVRARTAEGKEGWIFGSNVSSEKPEGGDTLLSRLGRGFRGEAAEVAASAGARGLDKTAEEYAARAGVGPQHVAAINRLEKFLVSDEEVDRFLREGRVGEFKK